MKQSRLRILSIGLVVLLGVTTAGLVWGGLYLKKLERQVIEKFEGHKWDLPSKIYSDSYLIYSGINLSTDDLFEKLRRLGYYEAKNQPKRRGEYRFDEKQGQLDIYLHDFAYPTEQFKGIPVRLSFQGERLARIQNQANGEELFSLELEPELVTGLYEKIWQERRIVKIKDVPPLLIKSVLAIEDERFYRHFGIDLIGMSRAMWVNLRSMSWVQGGSTLTQQLMKNFFLSDERKFSRKIPEALMAIIAERKYSKDVILENYLNEIYLGQRGAQGIFGVWEAAQFFYGKRLSELTAGESALLAGIIRAPNRYSPFHHPEAATKRRNVVLAKLLDDKIITRKQYDAALREPISRKGFIKALNEAPFYVDFLRRELEENYSNDVLTAKGLRIFTSLDLQLQRIAERSLSEGLEKLEKSHPALRKRAEENPLEGAIIVLRPQTGEIKAMVGGRNYQKSQFNRVFQARRQPGSIFKPFVYLAALMYGADGGARRFTPATLVQDAPFTWSYDRQEWQPGNYNNQYFGTVSFRRALEGSLNSATARVARDVGIRRVRDLAYKLGIQSPLPAVPSLSLGAAEVTPLEVAVAFSTLANNGVRTRSLAVKQVMNPDGDVLEKRDVRVQKVVSPQMAFLINYMLKGVMDRGTAAASRSWGFRRPAAGKTGTTNDYRDAWFVGYTPDLLAVVWVGFDNQAKLDLAGSEAALPIWTDFMKRATESLPATDFNPPGGIRIVEIDPLSGQAATANCTWVFREAFLAGEEPVETCPLHPSSSLQVSVTE